MTPPDRRAAATPLSQQLQDSLMYCWKEGVAAQVMISIVDYYLIPFALFLGGTSLHIGFLVAIPNLLASISQFFAVAVVQVAGSRRRSLIVGMAAQVLSLAPVGTLAFIEQPQRVWVLIVLIGVFRIVGALIGPAWGSMVSEYLPEHRRGQYFGWRSRIVGIAGVVSVAFWGVVLYLVRKVSPEVGFAMLFFSAAAARAIALYYMSRMAELPFHKSKETDFTFWMFIRRFRESNFVKFVLYVATITFATHIAGPYFSVYMLRDLKLNYLNYTVVHLAAIITGLIAFPIWGRHADHVGNARILKITGYLIPIIPLLWLISTHIAWIIVVELMAGFVWGGFNLCVTNFIYDAVTPSKRIRCLGYFNLITGVAIFLGASLGGYLADRLPPLFGHRLYWLFLLSGLLRLMASLLLSPQFREVRESTQTVSSSKLFFSVLGLRPLIGRNNEWLMIPRITHDPFHPRPKTAE